MFFQHIIFHPLFFQYVFFKNNKNDKKKRLGSETIGKEEKRDHDDGRSNILEDHINAKK